MTSKIVWFCIFIALFLGLAAVIGRISITGAAVTNRPPLWDYPTTEFLARPHERIWIKLNEAFFDPDGDVLEFKVTPGPQAVILDGEELTIVPFDSGEVWIEASDGKAKTIQKITILVSK